MESTKVIVTHRGALEAKYGDASARVFRAVGRLVAADARRGIASRLVALDRAADMGAFGAAPMGGADDREGAKRCVDAIDAKLHPHYFLILGSHDVVPMQLLCNTQGNLGRAADEWKLGDSDANVPSDLPYACDAGYSEDPADFLAPDRVVGRLPDVPGAGNPGLLVRLLGHAARARSLPRKAYEDWMGVTARTWESSTAKTMRSLFGDRSRLRVSPPRCDDSLERDPDAPRCRNRWSARELAARFHFYNCHGGNCDVRFLGESPSGRQVEAITTPGLRGRVTPGTVVVAECCYGAKVFSPRKADGAEFHGRMPIPLEYLRQGAAGFFGSTTIAYGEERRNDYADVICRHFARNLLAGCSLGRAALEARLAYLETRTQDDPMARKTLSQFCLLGDPSLHPVLPARQGPERAVRIPARVRAQAEKARAGRRKRIKERAARIRESVRELRYLGLDVPAAFQQQILALARKYGMEGKLPRVYEMAADTEAAAQGRASRRRLRRANQVVVMIAEIRHEIGEEDDREPGRTRPVPCYGGFVAYIQDGRMVTKRLVSR